jgi:hypothetical protein
MVEEDSHQRFLEHQHFMLVVAVLVLDLLLLLQEAAVLVAAPVAP